MPQASVTSHETLPVVALDGGGIPEMLQELAATADPDCTLDAQTDLKAALAARSAGPIAVVLTGLEQALAAALQDGVPPLKALKDEISRLEAQMADLRRQRRRFVILERTALAATPGAFGKVLAARLGCRFGTVTAGVGAGAGIEPGMRLLAVLLIQGSTAARRLEDELEASMAVPPVCHTAGAGLFRLHGALIDDRAALRSAQDGLEESKAQVAALTAERDARTAEVALLAKNVIQLQDQLKQISVEVRPRESRLAAAVELQPVRSDGNAAREAVLGAALLQKFIERDERDSKIADQSKKIGVLVAELEKVYGSKSWRVTGPMRAARSRLKIP